MDDRILPYCKHSITDPDTIIRYYEALETDNKARLTHNYYLAAKKPVKGTPEHQLAEEVKETRQGK